ncbi:hypothetical protein FOTG_16117 [Fusarium oxysporum f. sp. vasinfectum 25433]|uniref:Uncharacterized protein n=1 Tax=Fusarium oxysporum f. sp. vasinfectum 25433 TaxID=1089449 RepID=X0M4B2_FUSOX|nr:hypothetical protein FOTG_16117 [Fusarium oxysporum f. sp. vasinfectum 25433]
MTAATAVEKLTSEVALINVASSSIQKVALRMMCLRQPFLWPRPPLQLTQHLYNHRCFHGNILRSKHHVGRHGRIEY